LPADFTSLVQQRLNGRRVARAVQLPSECVGDAAREMSDDVMNRPFRTGGNDRCRLLVIRPSHEFGNSLPAPHVCRSHFAHVRLY
jgi:hypothetical protein